MTWFKEWLKKQFTEMTFYAGLIDVVFGLMFGSTILIIIGVVFIAIDDEKAANTIKRVAPFLSAKVDKVP